MRIHHAKKHAHFDEYLGRLSALEKKLVQWDTADAEHLDATEAWATMLPTGDALADASTSLFHQLSAAEGLAQDASSPIPADVADIAFIAKMEVTRMRSFLAKTHAAQTKWSILEACQRTRRHMLKAVTAVAKELERCTGEGDDVSNFVEQLERALQCRLALSTLWNRIESSNRLSVHQRLRLAGTAIAMLQGSEPYRELRIGDRIVLRDVQSRLLTWLRDEARTSSAGERILDDLCGLVELTRKINDRAELQEHDRALARELLVLIPTAPGASIPAVLLPRLRRLQGHDATLDAMLLGQQPLVAETVRRILRAPTQRPVAHTRRARPKPKASPRSRPNPTVRRPNARLDS